jgi:hypothetical protein
LDAILHLRNAGSCNGTLVSKPSDASGGHPLKKWTGNIASRLGRSLRWDAEKEEIPGDADANRRLHYEYRKPWKL